MKQILALQSKYDTLYFDASTPEALASAYLAVIKYNNDFQCYYEPTKSEVKLSEKDRELLDMSREQLEQLPELVQGEINSRIVSLRRRLDSANNTYNEEKFFWDQLQRVLNAPREEALTMTTEYRSGRNIRSMSTLQFIVDERSDYEYEHVELIRLTPGA